MLTCLIWTHVCERVWFPREAAVSEKQIGLQHRDSPDDWGHQKLSFVAVMILEKHPGKERRKKGGKKKKKRMKQYSVGLWLISKSSVKARRAGRRQAR